MPQRKNTVTGSVSSSPAGQPEPKDPGGLRGEEMGEGGGNGAGMEEHSQGSNRQSKLESYWTDDQQYDHPSNAPSKEERANDTEILIAGWGVIYPYPQYLLQHSIAINTCQQGRA